MPDVFRIIDALDRTGRYLAYVAGKARQGPGMGHPGHAWMLQQGLFPGLELIHYHVQRGYYNHLLFVEPKVPFPDELRLVEQDARADDQRGGNRELDDDQDLSRHGARRIEPAASLHALNRLRGGQQERRVASGQQADDQRDRRRDEQPEGMARLTREVRGYRLAREVVEIGRGQPRGRQGDDHRQHGQQDRFPQELAHQLDAMRSQHLSQSHFTSAGGKPGSRQVDEVDTSDDQDEEGDGRKNVDVVDVAVRARFMLEIGTEMDVRYRLQEEIETAAAFLELFPDVPVHEIGQLVLGGSRRLALGQQDVGVEIDPRPVPQVFLVCRGKGYDEIGLQVGIRRCVFHDARDCQQQEPAVGVDRPAHRICFAEILPGRVFADHHG